MVFYKYKSVSLQGKLVQGEVFVSSFAELKTFLKKQKLTLISSKEVKRKMHDFSKKEKVAFTRELARLLKAGISLYDALATLEEKYNNHRLYFLLFDLKTKIKQGQNLSDVLASYPKSFDFLFCSMIKNAEKAGFLQKTLEDLAHLLDKQEKLKKQIISALIYPAFILTFSICVVFSLLLFVIPSLNELFEGKNLHPITQFVLSLSHFLHVHKKAFFGSFGVVILGSIASFYVANIRMKIIGSLLRLPLLKTMFIKIAVVRFCRSLSVLLMRGVDYIQAIRMAKQTMKHPILEKEIEQVEPKIIQGEALSELLRTSSSMPLLVSRMMSVAEESGDLPSMLDHIVDFYQDEIDRYLLRLTTLLQPVLLLILGGLIGFIVLSVLLPLVDVGAFISE